MKDFFCAHQLKYCPPLAEIVDPVINPASSAAKNTTQRAISSGVPKRPTGICGMIHLRLGQLEKAGRRIV
jgi:hypothetical protein